MIEVYDMRNGFPFSKSILGTLSAARSGIAAASAGMYIVFVGGT